MEQVEENRVVEGRESSGGKEKSRGVKESSVGEVSARRKAVQAEKEEE